MEDLSSGIRAHSACSEPVVRGEASVLNKFHDHPDHELVQQKSQQLAGEATVPSSVISSCQIDKHGTSLFLPQKDVYCFVSAKRPDLW